MRYVLPALTVLLLAGCEPPVPDSRVGGVGFESYSEYQERRLAEGQTAAPAAAPIVPPQNTLPYTSTGAPTGAELAQAGIGSAAAVPQAQLGQPQFGQQPQPAVQPQVGQPLPVMGQQQGVAAATPYPPVAAAEVPAAVPPANPLVTETAAPATNHAGISDEQDFNAVAARESIESDKARLEQNRAQYQQIQPTELPERTDESEKAVDLVQYALNAPNRMGEAIYARSKIALTSSERACRKYSTPEAAQQAFLRSGGPKRDPKNLDPDGDGFACFWDPTPFQKARG